jgi:hypothetical protein
MHHKIEEVAIILGVLAREREQARATFRSLSRRSLRASAHRSPFSAAAGLPQLGQASPLPAAKQLQELQDVRRRSLMLCD